MTRPPEKFLRTDSKERLRIIFECIKANRGITMRDICLLTGYSPEGVRTAVNHLHGDNPKKQVYVSGWRRNLTGPISAEWSAGCRADAAKLEPYPKREVWRRYHARHRDERIEKQRARREAKAIKPFRDPLTAALFGDVTPH